VQKLMLPSLLCLLFSDAFSDHACIFLCVSMHLEAELLTHEEIPTQCRMTTQEWMVTQYDQASDTCMANRPNMRGNPTAHRTQPSLPASQALAPCARQPGFRARPGPAHTRHVPSVRSSLALLKIPEHEWDRLENAKTLMHIMKVLNLDTAHLKRRLLVRRAAT